MNVELSDQEFCCLVMRAGGVTNIPAALGSDHPGECRLCSGEIQTAYGTVPR